jgi:hypothetical protein
LTKAPKKRLFRLNAEEQDAMTACGLHLNQKAATTPVRLDRSQHGKSVGLRAARDDQLSHAIFGLFWA